MKQMLATSVCSLRHPGPACVATWGRDEMGRCPMLFVINAVLMAACDHPELVRFTDAAPNTGTHDAAPSRDAVHSDGPVDGVWRTDGAVAVDAASGERRDAWNAGTDAAPADSSGDAAMSDGAVSTISDAVGVSYLAACYEECARLLACADSDPASGCDAVCDAELARHVALVSAGTETGAVASACLGARTVEHRCLAALDCARYLEHYLRTTGEFPCRAEEEAMSSACT